MPTKFSRSVSLTSELTTLIDSRIAMGDYRSASEVVRAGLRALAKEERRSSMGSGPSSSDRSFLEGGGEVGALMRARDWSLTPLGDPSGWPQPLRTLVSVMLGSQQPMFVAWGPARTMLYNDGYAALCGKRHPAALGQTFSEVWFDLLDQVGPILDRAYMGQSTQMDDIQFTMLRNGYPEEAHFSFSYTPVRDEAGQVAGMFCACNEITEEVRARATLKAESERLREMFQQAPGFMALLRGPEHVFEFVNDAFLQLVGHRRDLVGKAVREALPEVEGQGFFELLDGVYTTGEPFIGRAMQIALQRTSDRLAGGHFVHFVYQPITDCAGKVTGILVEGYDVTEQVRAEAALRASEERNRQILNSATDYAIIATDLGGRITRWNEGARRVLGWTEEEIVGQPVHCFFTPEDVQSGRPETEMRLAREDGVANDERWHQRKSGERFWAVGELTPLRDDACKIVGFVKVLRDRTEQRQAEDTLRRYGALVESMTEGVSLSDEDGVIIYTNPAEDRMFGYEPGELIGQHVTVQNAYEASENVRRVEDVIAQLKVRGSWEGDWRNRRKDGTTFITASRITTVEINCRPHWLCVQRDITQAKRVEEQQKLLINELNHRVKNTLATVQSIAAQTFRDVDEESRPKLKAFEERLFALARAHDVLTRENWEGAELREIIAEVLEPYRRLAGERFEIRGPHLRLSPSMAVALAMAFHELATNASKYGALSLPKGRVSIHWTLTPGDLPSLTLEWRESHGPSVLPPTRRGFGTRLIERSLALDLRGTVRLTYDPSGVICRVEAPLKEHGSEGNKP